MYYFWFCIQFHDGHLTYPTSIHDLIPFFTNLWNHVRDFAAPNYHAVVVYLGYVVFSAILSMTMPGPIVKGLPVPSLNFQRLEYLCNGVSSFYLTLVTR